MILQPQTVELTKIHYYDSRNVIPTISREIFDNHVNAANIAIKKSLWGQQKWILKINEIGGKKKTIQWRRFFAIFFLIFIVVAMGGGTYFKVINSSGEVSKPRLVNSTPLYSTTPPPITAQPRLCQGCLGICLKFSETTSPKCVVALDRKDPTGCGGFCHINTQYCQLLDSQNKIYQCSNITNFLKCPPKTFNCGNMCVHQSKRCDGTINCSNKADEMNCGCNLDTHFRCGNMTSCLPKTKHCDGIVDCWDKSDEIHCKIECDNGTIPCLNGECIPKENFCDGKFHCFDRSDEPAGCQL